MLLVVIEVLLVMALVDIQLDIIKAILVINYMFILVIKEVDSIAVVHQVQEDGMVEELVVMVTKVEPVVEVLLTSL